MEFRCALSISLLLFSIQANSPPADKQARQIVTEAIEKAKFNNEYQTNRLEYQKLVLEFNLDDNGKPKSIHRNDVYRVFKQNGKMLEQLIERNGQPVKGNKPRENQSYGDINPAQLLRETLPQKFDFYFKDRQINIDGFRSTYAIGFRPKPTFAVENNLDQILKNVTGTIYIDSQKNTLRIEGKMTKTATFMWYIAPIKIYSFDFIFQQRKLQGMVVEDFVRLRIKFRVAIFFKKYREYNRIFEHYKFIPSRS